MLAPEAVTSGQRGQLRLRIANDVKIMGAGRSLAQLAAEKVARRLGQGEKTGWGGEGVNPVTLLSLQLKSISPHIL